MFDMRVDDMRFQFHGGVSLEDELYEAVAGDTFQEDHHEAASWHEWEGVEEVGWHENTNGHESWDGTMRVDDMRFQFHGGVSLEDAVDELYESMAGAAFIIRAP